VSGNSGEDAFPDISFHLFSNFIQHHFNDQISLATVLTVLFSITANSDLLNLHMRQQNPRLMGEVGQSNTGWIKALARALEKKLGNKTDTLFPSSEYERLSNEQIVNSISMKLDTLVKLLGMHQRGQKINPISEKEIEPALVICPISMECQTKQCQLHAIHQHTHNRDIPRVTLVKGTKIFSNVPVLAGHCPKCNTIYYADHECASTADNTWMKLYLNSAKYLKVGKSIWVDRIFSGAILNGVYSFHASTSAFVDF
jgi:hypothetical protein